MNGHRNHPQWRPQPGTGQHHYRSGPAAGERGEKFRMAGKAETALVEGFLVDGIGYNGGRAGFPCQTDGDFYGRDNGPCMGRVSLAQGRFNRRIEGKHRQCLEKYIFRFVRAAHRLNRDGQRKAAGKAPHPFRVVDKKKRRYPFIPAQPRLEGNFAADTRRFTHGQRQRLTACAR